MVSIGILGIMMAIAGSIFSLTLRSSGEATALIEANERIRAFEQTLRDDLRGVPIGASVLVLKANKVDAAWTGDQLDAGLTAFTTAGSFRDIDRETVTAAGVPIIDAPRADQLMFITGGTETSLTDPRVTGNLKVVVYSHAQTGTYDGSGNLNPVELYDDFTYRDPAQLDYDASLGAYVRVPGSGPSAPAGRSKPTPAREWIVARRAVHILNQSLSTTGADPYYPAPDLNDEDEVGKDAHLASLWPNLAAARWIRDGRRDYVVNLLGEKKWEDVDARGFYTGLQFSRDVTFRAARWDYTGSLPQPSEFEWLDPGAYSGLPARLMPLSAWMRRSIVDPTPGSKQEFRAGHLLLPNCASFKVEWAFDLADRNLDLGACDNLPDDPGLRDIFWVDPGNFAEQMDALTRRADLLSSGPNCPATLRNIQLALLPDPTQMWSPAHPTRFIQQWPSLSLTPPWPPLSAHVFYPTEPYPLGFPATIIRPDSLFPRALRVTIDVYDSANRLSRPIRHVMVLPVGQG